jgi:hypothetical protein
MNFGKAFRQIVNASRNAGGAGGGRSQFAGVLAAVGGVGKYCFFTLLFIVLYCIVLYCIVRQCFGILKNCFCFVFARSITNSTLNHKIIQKTRIVNGWCCINLQW